jgi:dihydroneopterin aldolase
VADLSLTRYDAQVDDVISVEGLKVDARIGVYPFEAEIRQRLLIDLRLRTDIAPAASSDDVSKTIDYDAVAEIARSTAREQHHRLIETVAEKIAARILDRWRGQVRQVSVRVAKPGAVPDAFTVAVEIVRAAERP